MGILSTLSCYALASLFYAWMIFWGGAEKWERWNSRYWFLFLDRQWNAEQFKFFAWCQWIILTILLILMMIL